MPVHEIEAGIYTVRSGLLNQDGKFRELSCVGAFQFDLIKEQSTIELRPQGTANCMAANPASFVERLGGDCELQPLILSAAEDESSFATSGATISCQLRSHFASKLILQSVSDRSIRLTHRGSTENVQSEIIFERISNEL
jgi:hypothetical protein